MKPLGALFICLLVAGVSPGQDTSGGAPPGVVILKLKWSRQIQFPRGWDGAAYDATGPINDPLSPTQRANVVSTDSPFPPGGKLPYVYNYSAKIRNDGSKVIKGVAWEFVTTDPVSKQELGRRQFFSYEEIGANKDGTLRGRSYSSPSKVVTAAAPSKDGRIAFGEQMVFRCVMYADGTWWMHPSVTEPECFDLKNREKMYKRMNR